VNCLWQVKTLRRPCSMRRESWSLVEGPCGKYAQTLPTPVLRVVTCNRSTTHRKSAANAGPGQTFSSRVAEDVGGAIRKGLRALGFGFGRSRRDPGILIVAPKAVRSFILRGRHEVGPVCNQSRYPTGQLAASPGLWISSKESQRATARSHNLDPLRRMRLRDNH